MAAITVPSIPPTVDSELWRQTLETLRQMSNKIYELETRQGA